MTLTAKKSMRYGGRSLEPGDAFEPASDRDARILQAIGKAEAVVAPAEGETPPKAAPKPRTAAQKKPKGYKRRDMHAEGSR